MSTLIIVGTQWGDEGKGKITDILSENYDIIVRYQGGNNAGHTVVLGNESYLSTHSLSICTKNLFNQLVFWILVYLGIDNLLRHNISIENRFLLIIKHI